MDGFTIETVHTLTITAFKVFDFDLKFKPKRQ